MTRLYADDRLILEEPEPDDVLTVDESKIALKPSDLFAKNSYAQPIQATVNYPTTFNSITNCKNCGAPLDRNKDCPYCGTKKQYVSEFVINEHEIRLSVG